jgi:hypothetical protein
MPRDTTAPRQARAVDLVTILKEQVNAHLRAGVLALNVGDERKLAP